MAYVVQQSDLDVIRQPKKTIYVKLELLNKKFQTIELVDGEIIQDDYSINADSDIRRIYNVTFVVNNSTFMIGRDKKIWLDKYIRISTGIFYIQEKETRWYPKGIYIFNTAGYSFDAAANTVSLSCLDRTAELLSERGSHISGTGISIPSYITDNNGDIVKNTVRDAMIYTITKLGDIDKYRIENINGTILTDDGYIMSDEIPYDLEFSAGSYVWDIIKVLKDLNVGLEAFFDEDMFICQPIPTYVNDPIVIDSETFIELGVNENVQYDFSRIKNVTEVWGKCLDSDYYTDNVSMDLNGLYTLSYGTVSELKGGTKFAFKADADNIDNAFVKVDNFTSYPLLIEGDLPIQSGRIREGISYVIQYVTSSSKSFFLFLGQFQICAVTKLVSKYPDEAKIQYDLQNEPTTNISYIIRPDSPFCSDYPDVGEIRQVFTDGEFENITSEDLALQHAKYENWKSTDMLDTINISTINIPWLDVNQKIEYPLWSMDKTQIYLVKSISGSTSSDTITINAVRFQPLYPWN